MLVESIQVAYHFKYHPRKISNDQIIYVSIFNDIAICIVSMQSAMPVY